MILQIIPALVIHFNNKQGVRFFIASQDNFFNMLTHVTTAVGKKKACIIIGWGFWQWNSVIGRSQNKTVHPYSDYSKSDSSDDDNNDI